MRRAQPGRHAPIRIIIPTAPGGSPDLVARMLGNKLTERLGQPVVVESVMQGVGLVGNQTVSRATPDGSTLRDADRRLHHAGRGDEVAAVRSGQRLFVRHDRRRLSDVPAGRTQFADCEPSRSSSTAPSANRDKVNYAIIGSGSVYHLLGKWIENQAGIELVGIPYRGSVPAFTDMIGGRVDAMLDTATSAISRIKNGQVRALAVSSPERYPLMPDVPTMNETVPGIKLMSWLGLATAPQTPRGDHRQAQRRSAARARPARRQEVARRNRRAGRALPRRRNSGSGSKPRSRSIRKIAEANGIKVE